MSKSVKRMVNKLYDAACKAGNTDANELFELEFCRRSVIAYVDEQPTVAKSKQELIDKFFAEPINTRNIQKLLDEHEQALIKGMIGD